MSSFNLYDVLMAYKLAEPKKMQAHGVLVLPGCPHMGQNCLYADISVDDFSQFVKTHDVPLIIGHRHILKDRDMVVWVQDTPEVPVPEELKSELDNYNLIFTDTEIQDTYLWTDYTFYFQDYILSCSERNTDVSGKVPLPSDELMDWLCTKINAETIHDMRKSM